MTATTPKTVKTVKTAAPASAKPDTLKDGVKSVFGFAHQTVYHTAHYLNEGIGLAGRTYERAYDVLLNGARAVSNPKV